MSMEAEEDDATRAPVGSPVPEQEGSIAPSGHQQELGTAGVQCESEVAGQLQEPPRDDLESLLPCMGEGTGEEGGGSAGGDGHVSDAAPCMDESTAAAELELVAEPSVAGMGEEEDSAACGGEGGDNVAVEETVPVMSIASSPQVQSRVLMAEGDSSHYIEGEEREAAADLTVSESAGGGLEVMKCSGVAEADKNIEEIAVASITDVLEDNRVVVEETGKETDVVVAKGLEVDIRVDHIQEVGNEGEAVAEETELEGNQEKEPPHVEANAFLTEIAHGKFDRDGKEVVADVSQVEVDAGVDQKEEAEEAAREMDVICLEADKGGELDVEEAAGTLNESMAAAVAVEESPATEVGEMEKEANNDIVVEAEEVAPDNRNVNDVMVEVEVKKAEYNVMVGDNEAQEAAVDNKETDEEVLDVAEAAEDMEVLHEDIDATEETVAAEEAEKAEEVSRSSARVKRKRGRAPKASSTPRIPSRRKMEEDVCFICFDGGDLVLCDRRKCPKAYHPSCVNRDEAFFRTKGQWYCGWHICSNCGKDSYFMCYTCTYSLCKTCIRDGSISCIRRNKGFCQTCMETILLIEVDLKGDDDIVQGQVDFDDKSSWEYLFKDYYMDLKARLSLTPEELRKARNLWKGSDGLMRKQESPEAGDDSDNSGGDAGVTFPKRRQSKRRAKSETRGRVSLASSDLLGSRKASVDDKLEWASKELLEFVMHTRNGDRSILSLYDVRALLLEYIERNNLCDPEHKVQIICDQRLQNLFGKPRVGHLEMLKLLNSHYFIKEDADDLQVTVVDTNANESEKCQRRFEEIPELHVGPDMDHSYVSKEAEVETDIKCQERYIGEARGTPSFGGREPICPQIGGAATYDSWNSGRTIPMASSQELNKNSSGKGLVSARDDYGAGAETLKENSFSRVKELGAPYQLIARDNMNMHTSPASMVGASRIISAATPETQSVGAPMSASMVNESEKMWHYQDPSGKVQGPFSMVQLCKWNTAGYFPDDLRIWRTTEGQKESLLLTDALNGKFQRDPSSQSILEWRQGTLVGGTALSLFEVPKYSGSEWGSSGSGTNLPSPLLGQTRSAHTKGTSVLSAGNEGGQAPALAFDASLSLSQGAQKPEVGRLLDSSISAPQLHSQASLPRESYSNRAASLSDLVQAVARNQNQSNPVQAEAVTAPSAYRPEPVTMPSQTQMQGPRSTSGGAVPSIPSFASYVSSGSANPWQVLGATNQSNVQSTALPNLNWLFGNNNNNDNSSKAVNNFGAVVRSTDWTQMQGTTSWIAPVPDPGNATMNWVGPTQGAPAENPAWPAQGQVHATVNPPHLGRTPTRNPNPGTILLGRGLTPVDSDHAAWATPWNQDGDGSQRNIPWNRQSSFGSVGGGPSAMSGWCQFFLETGHCKKGASCNYRHS